MFPSIRVTYYLCYLACFVYEFLSRARSSMIEGRKIVRQTPTTLIGKLKFSPKEVSAQNKGKRVIYGIVSCVKALIYCSLMCVMLFGHCAHPESILWIAMLWIYMGYITLTFLYAVNSKLPLKDVDPW